MQSVIERRCVEAGKLHSVMLGQTFGFSYGAVRFEEVEQ